MLTGTEIGSICVALGSIAGAFTVYFKSRGKTNGSMPKICAEHKAMAQNVENVKDDVKEIKATVIRHGETMMDIKSSSARIEGFLKGMASDK